MILSELGLSDSVSVPQCQYTQPFTVDNIIDNTPYFHNKERNSIKKVDLELAKELRDIYGQYGFDGYIAPYETPTHFECGWFNQECCVFDPNQSLIIVKCMEIQTGGVLRKNT